MRKIILFAFILLSFGLLAQQARPKVGIVLSGGGAKGFAHIGMLKVLDSLNIPVDYVAGTSMGAVVGSLYAIGYTPDQIEEIVISTDWDDLMTDAPKREYLRQINKSTYGRYLIKTSMQGLNVITPSGFISGQKMLAKLNEVTQNYHGHRNFLEDFPRKFLCVATDLRTGEEDVFTEGSLPDVVRASVSIPSMFTPYRIDGELKVDGGTVNNFPSDHLDSLGCDIIIGFSVQTPWPDTLVNVSIVNVLEMMGMFIDTKSNDSRQELCDLVIHPDLTGYGLTDFGLSEPIIKLGEESAISNLERLKEIEALFKAEKEIIPPYQSADTLVIGEVSVTGLKASKSDNVVDKFGIEPGERVSISELEYQLNLLYGIERFEQVQYKLHPQDTGSTDLEIQVIEKASNTQVGGNIHYDTDFGFALGLNLTLFDALMDGATFGADLLIRENVMFKFYYDFDRGKYPGFYFETKYFSAAPRVYEEKNYLGELLYSDWTTKLAYQSNFNRKYNLRLGIGLDYQNYNFERIPDWVSDPINQSDSSKLKTLHLNLATIQLGADDLDNTNFPTKGTKAVINGQLTHLLSESFDAFDFEPFATVSFDYLKAMTPNKWVSFIPKVRAGFTLMNESSFPYKFFTGSFGNNHTANNRSFPGYRFMEYAVKEDGAYYYPQNISSVECAVRFNSGKYGYVSVFGGVGSASHDIDRLYNSESYFGGFGASYSLNTILGPIQIMIHKSTEFSPVYGYFTFGFWL